MSAPRPRQCWTVLRVMPEERPRRRDLTATHTMPSGLGGVFDVEVLERGEERSRVRIHMPGTDWHHWQGVLTPLTSELVEIVR